MTADNTDPAPARDGRELLLAAQTGDDHAFSALVEPFRRELHIHCYRMLGSLEDADDAMQESMLRAWRHLSGFEPQAPFRAWLYRIATNACLTMLDARIRRRQALPPAETQGDHMRLDPYPEAWLDGIESTVLGPEATIEREESVHLAFIASMQLLPSRQRASLVLRDVLGFSANEVASMLNTSVASANSALQRAREKLEQERAAGRVSREHGRTTQETEAHLVRSLIEAWHSVDVPSIVKLLSADSLLTMPPEPTRVSGPAAIGAFLATVPGKGRLDRFRLIPARANRQPAVAGYFRTSDSGPFYPYSFLVLAISGESISSMIRFADTSLFRRFELPESIEDGEKRMGISD